MGPHVAALGLVFSQEGNVMGEKFGNGAFVARDDLGGKDDGIARLQRHGRVAAGRGVREVSPAWIHRPAVPVGVFASLAMCRWKPRITAR